MLLFSDFYYVLIMWMCVCVWFVRGYGHMGAGAFGGQRHMIPLGLLLLVVVSCLAWLLGLECWATERTYVLLS